MSTRQETDRCEFAQHGFIRKSIWNMICVYLWVYVYIQRGSKCEHLQGHRRIRVAQFGFIWYNECILVNICIQKDTNKRFKVWAIARAQTYVSFAQHRFIYKSVYDITYVYLWVKACIQRASMCEHLQGRKHEWSRTTWVHIQNHPWYDMNVILANICMYTKRF